MTNNIFKQIFGVVTSSSEKRFSAFTLAETLIVIGIIGVVAGLTIPDLNRLANDTEKIANIKKSPLCVFDANHSWYAPTVKSGSTYLTIFDSNASGYVPTVKSGSTYLTIFDSNASGYVPTVKSGSTYLAIFDSNSANYVPTIKSGSTYLAIFDSNSADYLPTVKKTVIE